MSKNKNLEPIHELFPLSKGSVSLAFEELVEEPINKGGDTQAIFRLRRSFMKNNPDLFVFTQAIGTLFHRLSPERFDIKMYGYGRDIGYRIFQAEAQSKGGILPRISPETLGVFVRDTLHISPEGKQKPIHALQSVSTEVNKVVRELRTSSPNSLAQLHPQFSRQTAQFLEFVASNDFDNDITRRIEELGPKEEPFVAYYAFYAEDFTKIPPTPTITDALILAGLDIYKIFRNNLETRRIQQMLDH